MCFKAWRRKSFRRTTRVRLRQHRDAVRHLARAYTSLKVAQAYHPVCLGGLEDRFAGIDQAENAIVHWFRERERIERCLGASQAQIVRLRSLAAKHQRK